MSDFSAQLRRQFIDGLNASRLLAFGENAVLRIFEFTPTTGENELTSISADWFGKRDTSPTESGAEANRWLFFVGANTDWETTQSFFQRAVFLKIGTRKWKILKIEKPTSELRAWRVKAELG
jgi:hypothetical protein